MNAIVTMTSRGVLTLPEGILLRPAVTLPVEVYSEERVREFDEAEAELSAVLRGKRKR